MFTKSTPNPARIAPVPPAGRSAGRPRLVALDGLRLIAALLVVFHHYVGFAGGPGRDESAWTKPAWVVFPKAENVASYGWVGVELFFIISGFVICMSSWGRGPGAFFKSRVVRLYPAYWFAVLATTAVLTVWPMVRKPLGLRDTLLNLTMFQSPFGAESVDAVYWTLWVEMRFYLLFALVVWKGVTYRRVVLFCCLWTIASILVMDGRLPSAEYFAMPEYSSYFIAGMAMYLMYRFRPTALLWGIVGISWLFSVHAVSQYSVGLGRWLGRPMYAAPAVLLVTLAYLVMAALALGWLDWVRGRWLTVAGAVTYPLYLLHEHIGWTGIRLLRDRVPAWPLVIGMTLGMVAAAWLVHRLVERPVARMLSTRLAAGMADLRERPMDRAA
ncbi:acyltransferase family protein [Kitasatospora sp. NPDC058170]|uniref:acyltransferase family protein n=1 Tax=Kitasatospora sp. NPDC058170 TaxID=3346364 RepID=UPI0036DDFC76